MNIFYKNVLTNYVTITSFNTIRVKKVEGTFFKMQSWFRAQFDKKKLAKQNELQFLVSFFCKMSAKYHSFFLKT